VIIRILVEKVKAARATPFIVPAMGSHGGGDAESQTELLGNFGITEDRIGAEIRSSVETEFVGRTEEGLEVRIDKNAARADGIIVVGRVKPHTSFRGKVESGLMKMMAIGLGKPYGAFLCHQLGFSNMGKNVWDFGNVILKHKPVLFGLALIDNKHHRLCRIEASPAENIPAREPELLEEARKLMPVIPFENIDLLIVDEIGKEYSGTGMDMNVTGRSTFGDYGPAPKRIAVLDLTDRSRGNAVGIGEADVITERLEKKIDRKSVYVNAITVREIGGLRVPAVMPSDRLSIQLCLHTLLPPRDPSELRAVWIHNTLHPERMLLSEGLMKEASEKNHVRIAGPPQEINFDKNGNVVQTPSMNQGAPDESKGDGN
jgi:hypothetical protein